MKRQRWLMSAALMLLMLAAVDVTAAAAGVIAPVNSATAQLTTPSFTVSIYDAVTKADITDVWLPEWVPAGGTPVYVVFHDLNGNVVTPTSLSLVPGSPNPPTGSVNPAFNSTTSLRTTSYPGKCTNFGDPNDLTDDFTFNTAAVPFISSSGTAKTGYLLTPQDCGGFAVISATVGTVPHTFILPQSSAGANGTTISGIPDIWAAAFCPSNSCPTGKEDGDTSPGNTAQNGDGYSAFDEYRGFIVSGAHIRTDPRQKDLFIHLVNPQCIAAGADPLTSTASLLGGGTNTISTGNPIFSNVETLISGTQIHRLNYANPNAPHYTTNEWVDRFLRYTVVTGLEFGTTGASTTVAPSDDRQMNRNAVYFTPDPTSTTAVRPTPQKGLRLIECVDATVSPSLLGFASVGSPNGQDNAIIFTQRVVNYFTNTLGATCTSASQPDCLFYSTFQNGAWTTPARITPQNLFAVAVAYYAAMEIGHTTQLTPSVEGTQKVSYGYHHAPGTGSNLDQGITNKVTRTGNTFYIPQLYNTTDLANYKLK